MDLVSFLHDHSEKILDDACAAMDRSHLRSYEKVGAAQSRQRLKALFVLTVRAVQEKNLGPIMAHSENIANERFQAGFDLSEVQTAFNVLEEAIWLHVLRGIPPQDLPRAIGLISTVLGAGKDMLARTYVSLASKTKTQTLNLQSLFTGTN